MNLIIASFLYVIHDPYFLVSMGMTVSIGIFVGAAVYDGVLVEVKKAILVMGSYIALILMTNFARIYPIISSNPSGNSSQPFAGMMTTLLVSLFYILGMLLGVFITNKCHKGRKDA